MSLSAKLTISLASPDHQENDCAITSEAFVWINLEYSTDVSSAPVFTSASYSITQQCVNAANDPAMIVREAFKRQAVCTDELSPVSVLMTY